MDLFKKLKNALSSTFSAPTPFADAVKKDLERMAKELAERETLREQLALQREEAIRQQMEAADKLYKSIEPSTRKRAKNPLTSEQVRDLAKQIVDGSINASKITAGVTRVGSIKIDNSAFERKRAEILKSQTEEKPKEEPPRKSDSTDSELWGSW